MYKSDYSYVVAFWAMTDPQMVASANLIWEEGPVHLDPFDFFIEG